MNTLYLQYVREQLMVATADLSGETKGQLLAWLENAQFDTKNYPRKKQRIWDEETESWITLNNPPIPGKQSLAKGSAIPLVKPVEYSTASWRRAVLSLDEHYKAWLLWNYSENTCWEHQVEITSWAWCEFRQQLAGRKMAGKTVERLKKLIWLAAQDVKSELAEREVYQYKDLVGLVGVSEKNWSETFTRHWLTMRTIFLRLDQASLLSVSDSRSEQVAFNLYALN
ncbi:antiterminator [Salmonella enterica subsp. enterica serovar Lexington]|uniref:bacteriophage antitermination protein Q n=1 Tax=Salmonella enterica TaxID=28901 RepID=UPI000FBE0937|nr:antiterminator [Salmonella enterica subsp. enterica serovar Lexington]EAA7886701.1 antiterminator [Salmonella enterica]EBS5025387.1 antiterminator [Salmonella enterica subsp. enterica serovar Give]ECC3313063.1 antiterminator [Salmonella enterica subsp. enterica]ECD0643449.1 antiterminator [Salmonella enterica subsp. enterica serovar Saintpaul]EDA7407925.1 antiterminator [Salmonella enterica subsp. enterica serovar Sandiego]EDW0188033.1 antiterminator [Salmonella enterica subsp. enterica se